jgi:hypothetical protein
MIFSGKEIHNVKSTLLIYNLTDEEVKKARKIVEGEE